MSTSKTVVSTQETKNSAYSRLSISKNRITVVISVPCANVRTLAIADSIDEQAEKVIDYVQTHELQSL